VVLRRLFRQRCCPNRCDVCLSTCHTSQSPVRFTHVPHPHTEPLLPFGLGCGTHRQLRDIEAAAEAAVAGDLASGAARFSAAASTNSHLRRPGGEAGSSSAALAGFTGSGVPAAPIGGALGRYGPGAGAAGRASSSAGGGRCAPPPPPRPRKEGDWDCAACTGFNFASKLSCFKCGAPPPPPGDSGGGGGSGGGVGGDKEGGEEDSGVYTIEGVTYLDGKRHEAKLVRNTSAQVHLLL
jgi:hypothetical protein